MDVKNGTIFATTGALNTIIYDEHVGLKDNVPSSKWAEHIVEEHSDSIQNKLQCQGLLIEEAWHFTVFDDNLKTCYLGKMKNDEKITVDDDTSRQVSINTDILDSFISDTFTTRQSTIYRGYYYTYFYNYKDSLDPHYNGYCSVHCFFDTENKCDFWYMSGHYCYLGNFNQGYSTTSDTSLTTYIYKGNKYMKNNQ